MKQADPETAHCAIRLRAAVSHLSRQLRSALPSEGISVAKLSVLGQLHHHGSLTPGELAQRERVKPQSLTRLLAELESDGWMLREPHGSDGRQSTLSLTRRGVKLLAADVHRREASLVEAIDVAASPEDRALLLRACELLDQIADAVERSPASAAPPPHEAATSHA